MIASFYNFWVGSYTEFMEENFTVSSKSVDSARELQYLWKSQTKANHGRTIAELAFSHNIK